MRVWSIRNFCPQSVQTAGGSFNILRSFCAVKAAGLVCQGGTDEQAMRLRFRGDGGDFAAHGKGLDCFYHISNRLPYPIVRIVPLTPIHDMSEIRGAFAELTDPQYYAQNPNKDHYLRIVLTDENDIPDAVARLRMIYKNLMNLTYDNERTRQNNLISGAFETEKKSAFELFSEFYELRNNAPMSTEQSEYMRTLIEKIEEETI